MANLSDQLFPPTNLGRVEDELVPPGRKVSQPSVYGYELMPGIVESFVQVLMTLKIRHVEGLIYSESVIM
ncbi:hypothetical protein TNCV_93371 [Trichonephila clavipes]|nr:hypothetical protein TNCV_93371 [Trichonephila clavipes]